MAGRDSGAIANLQAMTGYAGPEADAARREARATSRRRTLAYLPGDGRDQGGMEAR